jgi:regulator of replication initiation timing
MEIPISTASHDQLPAETPIKLDEIYRIIGSLYLDSYRRVSTLESHFKSIISQYVDDNNNLRSENEELKKALNNDR